MKFLKSFTDQPRPTKFQVSLIGVLWVLAVIEIVNGRYYNLGIAFTASTWFWLGYEAGKTRVVTAFRESDISWLNSRLFRGTSDMRSVESD